MFTWTHRKQVYQIVPTAAHLWSQAPKQPYVLLNAQGQVLSGITEHDLIWYRQRQKEHTS